MMVVRLHHLSHVRLKVKEISAVISSQISTDNLNKHRTSYEAAAI